MSKSGKSPTNSLPEPVPAPRLVSDNPLKRYCQVKSKNKEGGTSLSYRFSDPLDLLRQSNKLNRDQYEAARRLQEGAATDLHSPTVVFGYTERLGRGNDEMSDQAVERLADHRAACKSIDLRYRECVLDFVVYGKPLTSLRYLQCGLSQLSHHYRYG